MATEKTKILNVIQIEGKQYAVVDVGPTFVKGHLAKYIIVPMSGIDGTVDQDIRVYEDTKI